MSELYAIGFKDVATAEEVRNRVIELQKQKLIDLDDVVVVQNVDGKIKLRQGASPAAAGAAGGALWGGLIGLLFLSPLLGMAIGAGVGAAGGALADVGIDDNFMKEVGRNLPEGGAALFLLVRRITEDKVITELAAYDGKLIRSSLSQEDEDHLRSIAQAARATQKVRTT